METGDKKEQGRCLLLPDCEKNKVKKTKEKKSNRRKPTTDTHKARLD